MELDEKRCELFDVLISQLSEFAIVLADEGGNFTTWHPGVQEIFGYDPDEFIGMHVDRLLPIPDRLKGVAQEELKTAAKARRASDTRMLVKKGGQQILVEGVTVGLRKGGLLMGFGKVLRDVTAQKDAAEGLRALASALEQAMVIVRRWDGTITHWTAGCEKLYGYKQKEAAGQICQELLKTSFLTPQETINRQLLEEGRWEGEIEHTRKDGVKLTVATSWVAIPDGESEFPVVIETQTDVTARSTVDKQLQEAHERLKGMTTELERSNEELEEFARIASHDLSAPITSTRWLMDLLKAKYSEKLGEDGQQTVDQVIHGLERMSELVEGVLAHARVGRTAIGSAEPNDAGESLSIALESLQKHIETSGAVIRHGLLPEVMMTAQALSQLFQNLLSNAIKYRREGIRPEVAVTASRQNDMWLFTVKDNGMGIEPEWYERIFQPMQRRHGGEISGSGIGLATCRKIVMRAGGRIWVESELGIGSEFHFTLPGR